MTRAPGSSIAATAFGELGIAVDLFEKAAALHSRRTRSALVRTTIRLSGKIWIFESELRRLQAVLTKLRDKAFRVYSKSRSGQFAASERIPNGGTGYDGNELATFGGQKRVLIRRTIPGKKPTATSSGTPSTSIDIWAPSPVDTSLEEYLSLIPHDQAQYSSISPEYAHVQSGPSYDATDPAQIPFSTYLPSPVSQSVATASLTNAAGTGLGQDPQSSLVDDFDAFQRPDDIGLFACVGNVDNLMNSSAMVMETLKVGESGMDQQWLSFMRESGILGDESDLNLH